MKNVMAVSKIKDRTCDDTWMEGGKLIERVHGVVSPDGGTRTLTVDGPGPQGHPVHNDLTFDRQ